MKQKDVEGLAGDVPVDRLNPEQLRRYQAWKRSRFERGPVREVSSVCLYFHIPLPNKAACFAVKFVVGVLSPAFSFSLVPQQQGDEYFLFELQYIPVTRRDGWSHARAFFVFSYEYTAGHLFESSHVKPSCLCLIFPVLLVETSAKRLRKVEMSTLDTIPRHNKHSSVLCSPPPT